LDSASRSTRDREHPAHLPGRTQRHQQPGTEHHPGPEIGLGTPVSRKIGHRFRLPGLEHRPEQRPLDTDRTPAQHLGPDPVRRHDHQILALGIRQRDDDQIGLGEGRDALREPGKHLVRREA
jgi:hypothetical protein